jgi:nucleoside-diphosphate kinase
MEAGKAGAIIARLQEAGFAVQGMRQLQLTRAQAEGFYDVHRGKGFFDELCAFMSRGPIVVMALEAEDAIAKYREVIGATDPKKAAPGTIRALYGKDVGENAVHGSDSVENAAREIGYFFAGCDVRPSV